MPMVLLETVVTKLQQLPESEQERLLRLMDEWIEELRTVEANQAQQAQAAVENTWATIILDGQTARWIAENKELEYDLG
jgi:hypothetical protein